ncbi:hypothetical protein Pan153_11740 [Gimesia panareensis]|uniref:Uncharacterized protein n=1 Tax=Gimesia panareensis TaxID=2527978 RepID=A0A518FJK7_9PLAN|nr:hypothetical protein Pan153_11740 [Gimesia panareensis]
MTNSNNDGKTPDRICNYFKHISTLSTGSILLIVTFQEKLKDQKHVKWCIPLSIVLFLVCLWATFSLYSLLIFQKTDSKLLIFENDLSADNNRAVGLRKNIAVYSFQLGVSLLVFYFLVNFISG